MLTITPYRAIVAAAVLALLTLMLPFSGRSAVAVSDLTVEISLSDGKHSFAASSGEDLGDFSGPGFVQHNLAVHDPKIPFSVFFRPDRDSERVEVVFVAPSF